jgi:hypothetical protein
MMDIYERMKFDDLPDRYWADDLDCPLLRLARGILIRLCFEKCTRGRPDQVQRFPLEEIFAYISHDDMTILMAELGLDIKNVKDTKFYRRYLSIRFGDVGKFLRSARSENLTIPYYGAAGLEFIKRNVVRTQGLVIFELLVQRARFEEAGHELN